MVALRRELQTEHTERILILSSANRRGVWKTRTEGATLKAGNPESGIRNPESEIQRKSENKVNKKSFVTEPKTRRKKKCPRRRAGLCNTLVCAAL